MYYMYMQIPIAPEGNKVNNLKNQKQKEVQGG